VKDNFTIEEEQRLREALIRGETPVCPRCRGALELTPILPTPDVAYVRNRVLMQCGTCGLKGVVDRR
jgi:hypothetical protein